MPRQRTGLVMVEIAHGYPGFEQSDQILAVLMERNVEHRNVVAGLPLDATQQCNVALDAGDERSSLRFSETKLLQGAQAIGIAVERVVGSHNRLAQTNTAMRTPDRKSTRLNSSHVAISYAVFCLK